MTKLRSQTSQEFLNGTANALILDVATLDNRDNITVLSATSFRSNISGALRFEARLRIPAIEPDAWSQLHVKINGSDIQILDFKQTGSFLGGVATLDLLAGDVFSIELLQAPTVSVVTSPSAEANTIVVQRV